MNKEEPFQTQGRIFGIIKRKKMRHPSHWWMVKDLCQGYC